MKMRIYCNPLNVEYKFQHLASKEKAHREAADPTLVLFKDTYYFFASMSGGFWYSDDLINWNFHENRDLQIYLYAPDVRQIGDYLYFSASRRTKASMFLRTRDPLSDIFEEVNAPFPFWDPNLFYDDDKSIYFYWGCSNKTPIYGIQMNQNMKAIGERVELFSNNIENIGWERTQGLKKKPTTFKGKLLTKILGDLPFIEGAFMNKYRDKYYLQYAAPGTEIFTYGDGVYVSDQPLGPFEMQKHNPFSTKPGGFIKGAGHGSTIEDKYGNWWHMSTMVISVNANFERRLGLFPCGFDEDGLLFCNQNYADYPMEIPEGPFNPWDLKPEWMLLSYEKETQASSSKENHPSSLAVNESVTDWWVADSNKKGEWLQVDLGEVCDVNAIQINFADDQIEPISLKKDMVFGEPFQKRYIDLDSKLYTRYILEGSVDGKSWFLLWDKSEAKTNLCHDLYVNKEGIMARYIKVTGFEFPYNSHMALSGLRVFGKGKKDLPKKIKASAKRISPLDALIQWEDYKDAVGYNLLYGIAKDKLYSSYMVYGETSLNLSLLNKGQDYYLRVDAFNEAGIQEGEVFKL